MAFPAKAASSAMAQDITGDWQGTLKVGTIELRLVMQLVMNSKGGVQGAIESIDQPGGTGMAITAASFDNSELRLSLKEIGATYEGKLSPAGTIEGSWTQAVKIPLFWERKAAETSEPADYSQYVGAWHGDLNLGLMALYLVIHIGYDAGGKPAAALDSPDQGGPMVPATGARIEKGYLTVEWKSIGAVFRVRTGGDPDVLDGSFTQHGRPGALKLKRVHNSAELQRRRPQMPVNPYPYREEEVKYQNPNAEGSVTLAGTLTVPQGHGPFPAAILIAGSGDLDRDESIGGHKPFLVIADFLTRKGIAVLRVDKRGVGGSGGDSFRALTTDYASDVQAGVAFLRKRPEVDGRKIGLVGHSEGGVIAPMVAIRDRGIAFLVLMAGTGVPGAEFAGEQAQSGVELAGGDPGMAATAGKITSEVASALIHASSAAAAKKKLMAKADAIPEAMLDTMIERLDSPWLRAFVAIDPRVALRSVACPVLAINGANDKQVSAGPNLAGIRQALLDGGNPHFEVEELAGLNHLFQAAETGAPLEYGHIEETISPLVLDRMATFIRSSVQWEVRYS
jgi:hypothetical protein